MEGYTQGVYKYRSASIIVSVDCEERSTPIAGIFNSDDTGIEAVNWLVT